MPETKKPLSLKNLGMGDAIEAINDYIRKAEADAFARPLIETPRKITLTIKIAPKVDENTGAVYASVAYQVEPGFPPLKGTTVAGKFVGNTLYVDEFFPEIEPGQTNLVEMASQQEKGK